MAWQRGFVRDLLLLATILSLLIQQTQATWSIVALDKESGRIGVASNTCITVSTFYPRFLQETFVYVPGQGAIVAQAWYTDYGLLQQAKDRIRQGNTTGKELLDLFGTETRCFDPNQSSPEVECSENLFRLRDLNQYGIVLRNEENATTFTGPNLEFLYTQTYQLPDSEQVGRVGVRNNLQFSVQGNIVEKGTVDAVYQAFPTGCDLADQLLTALEAGAGPGYGDVRCTQGDTGKTALVGYLRVIEADGTVVVDIEAVSFENDSRDTVEILRASLDAVERENCENKTSSPSSEIGDFSSAESFTISIALSLVAMTAFSI